MGHTTQIHQHLGLRLSLFLVRTQEGFVGPEIKLTAAK